MRERLLRGRSYASLWKQWDGTECFQDKHRPLYGRGDDGSVLFVVLNWDIDPRVLLKGGWFREGGNQTSVMNSMDDDYYADAPPGAKDGDRV